MDALESSTFTICAKLNKLVVNLGWESEASPAAVYQEVVQILPHGNVVPPQASDGVGNSRKILKQCQRLDLHWKAGSPPHRGGQLLIEWLRPSPVPGV